MSLLRNLILCSVLPLLSCQAVQETSSTDEQEPMTGWWCWDNEAPGLEQSDSECFRTESACITSWTDAEGVYGRYGLPFVADCTPRFAAHCMWFYMGHKAGWYRECMIGLSECDWLRRELPSMYPDDAEDITECSLSN